MQKIFPFLWFNDQAEEAVNLYATLFNNSKIGAVTHYSEDVPGPKGKVITISFELAGQEFLALNGGPEFTFTPATSFYISCQTPEEIDRLYAGLSQGGAVLMEMGQYPFSEKFAWVVDRFGVSWQMSLARVPQKITPFLMFVGAQHGRAEEAINYYTALFPNSSISQIQRYGEGQHEPAGTVMHATFNLNGTEFMAIDSSYDHQFTFTPAISFFILCDNQSEVDYFWEKLTDGGEKGQCGWLVDRFGVSWQDVPTVLNELLSDPDPARAGRVTQAMLQMTKIDIGQLKQAYEQA